MRKTDILKKIVAEGGSCQWVFDEYKSQNICARCPMQSLRKKDNGENFSCYEAICGNRTNLHQSEVNRLYSEEAKRLLVTLLLEEELGLDEGN